MSLLQLTIYSDSEEEAVVQKNDNKKKGTKRKNANHGVEEEELDMNNDFEFGGLLVCVYEGITFMYKFSL